MTSSSAAGREPSRAAWLLALLSLPALFGPAPAALAEPRDSASGVEREKVILSTVFTVDQKYKSMMGPWKRVFFDLAEPGDEEETLYWITGFEAVIVGPDGETPGDQEFMCHSNLDFDPDLHNDLFDDHKLITTRLFTLSQGQTKIEFPPGFGLPIHSQETLDLTNQVLNLNHDDIDVELRQKVTIHYVRNEDLARPLKPLWVGGAYGLKLIDGQPGLSSKDGYWNIADADPGVHGPGCSVGRPADADKDYYVDPQGRKFTGHWIVAPGREVTYTNVTEVMALPYDTTVHYIAVHLHPFCESIELKDLTTGETVWKSKNRQLEGRIGLAEVEHFSSVEGIPLYADHEYQVVTIMNNTSGEPQDAMAVLNMYLWDRDFEDPTAPFSLD